MIFNIIKYYISFMILDTPISIFICLKKAVERSSWKFSLLYEWKEQDCTLSTVYMIAKGFKMTIVEFD